MLLLDKVAIRNNTDPDWVSAIQRPRSRSVNEGLLKAFRHGYVPDVLNKACEIPKASKT